MAGRRSHPRFEVTTPWDGAMRILRDVVLDRGGPDELLALSQTPGVLGEEMTLDLIGGGSTLGLRVKVLESRPVVIDGAVRHRIRLSLLDGSRQTSASDGATIDDLLAGGALPAEAF